VHDVRTEVGDDAAHLPGSDGIRDLQNGLREHSMRAEGDVVGDGSAFSGAARQNARFVSGLTECAGDLRDVFLDASTLSGPVGGEEDPHQAEAAACSAA